MPDRKRTKWVQGGIVGTPSDQDLMNMLDATVNGYETFEQFRARMTGVYPKNPLSQSDWLHLYHTWLAIRIEQEAGS